MSPKRKDNDVSATDIRANLPAALADMVSKAADLGWRVTWGNHGNFILTSDWPEDGPRTVIELPKDERTVRYSRLQAWRSKILRYAPDRAKVAALANGGTPPAPVEPAATEPVAEPFTVDTAATLAKEADEAEAAATVDHARQVAGEYEVVDGKYKCPSCDTLWPSKQAVGAHRKKHAYEKGESKHQRQEGALMFVIEVAEEALGIKRADEDELAHVKERLALALASVDSVKEEYKVLAEAHSRLQDKMAVITAALSE
jgi:hypothetical protein